MSDQQTNVRPGSASDRKISTGTATAAGAASGFCIGMCDWLTQCMASGHWHWVAPSQSMIEVGAPIIVLPVALWLGRVLSLVGEIITNHLQKDSST
jgi:hypothetical protein